MRKEETGLKTSRRKFLRQAALSSGAALAGAAGWKWAAIGDEKRSRLQTTEPEKIVPGKTVLSFYVDDTTPYVAGAGAFKQFLDFVAAEKIAGESSVILGYGWEEHGLLNYPRTDEQKAYIEQLHRAFECGIDSHMELMTHRGLFDFRTGRASAEAEHEGVWLYEPKVSLEAYETYFGQILDEGKKIGVQFTGVTWPGCGCTACVRRYSDLFGDSPHQVNPNVWKALLNLAKKGKFRGPTVPCFILGGEEEHPLKMMAGDKKHGVYDLYPHATDHLGIWDNLPSRVNPDYYITANGDSGGIVDKIRAKASHCVFYGHWQGINPVNGVGWEAFRQVVQRIQKHYGDQVAWMRPSALTEIYHRQTERQNG